MSKLEIQKRKQLFFASLTPKERKEMKVRLRDHIAKCQAEFQNSVLKKLLDEP